MNFVFLMDPLESVNPKKDTSYCLMLGAKARGHTVYYLRKGGMSLINGEIVMDAQEVFPQKDEHQPFRIIGHARLTPRETDAVFIRTDPPFNQDYLEHTWLLDHLPPSIPVINRPSGVRSLNEKIWAARYTDITPRTYIGRDEREIGTFLTTADRFIAKPTDGFGGQGVFLVSPTGQNTQVILETLSDRFTRDIILQEFVADSEIGDKRILLLDGEPLGAVLRVHKHGEHRNNFFSGGKPVAVEITNRDREIIARVRPDLKKLGLIFVGIDIIGDYLIEINVTSPTCLQEMNRLAGKNLENRVIAFTENLVRQSQIQGADHG